MTDYKLVEHRDKAFFRDLAVGEMFLDEMEKPCVRTLDAIVKNLKDEEEVNAVRITDGEFYYFQDNWAVVRIKKAVFTV